MNLYNIAKKFANLKYALVLFILLGVNVYGQKPILAPVQDRIEHIAFSSDGTYLLTGSSDHKVIITDLKKRLAIQEIKDVDFLASDENQNYFFVKRNSQSDSILIEKRAIPSTVIQYTLKIPKKLNGEKLIIEGDLINISSAEETFQYIYREGYDFNASKHLITFSKTGALIEDVKGLTAEVISGIVKVGKTSWVISSSALWKQNGDIFEKVLQPNFDKNAFANFKVKGDTLVLLSNKEIQWYSIKNNKIFKSYNISSISAIGTGESSRLMNMRKNHPFYLDQEGSVWFADTHLNFERSAQKKEQFYKLASVKDDLNFPLTTRLVNYNQGESIAECFAYDEKRQIFALLVNNHIEIVDRKTGYLFSTEKQYINLEYIYFTSIPGQVLFTTSGSSPNPAYMLNLSNGWIDAFGAIDKSYYSKFKTRDFVNYTPSAKTIQVFNVSEKKFEETVVLKEHDNQYLTLPIRKNVSIETKNNFINLDNDNVLRWINKQGSEIGKIDLKIKTERIVSANYVYQKYIFNESAHLLILFYSSQRDFSIQQIWIDAEKHTVIKETDYKDLALFNDAKKYICPKGIFNIDGSLVKSYPVGKIIELLTLSKSEDYFIGVVSGYTNGDELYCWDWKKDKLTLLGKQLNIDRIVADPNSELIFTHGAKGSIIIWNPLMPATYANILVLGPAKFKQINDIQAGYLILLSNGYYMGSGKYTNFLSLDSASNNYSTSYIDGTFHRPDLVLSAFGYTKNQSFLKSLQSLAIKRSSKFKISQAGVDVAISNKSSIPYYEHSGSIEIRANIKGNLKNAKTYMIYVNGTAFMPFPGKAITGNQISERMSLKDESNHIKICLMDFDGIETQGDFLFVNAPVVKKRNLFFIGIGVSQYLDKNKNLKYAAKDVNDVMTFFKTNKSYAVKNFCMLSNEKALVKNITDSIKNFLKTTNEEDQVLFFFAGHGLIGKDDQYYLATHDIDFKLPQLKGLNINAISELLSACKARKKIMFIDACHSGLIEDMAVAESTVKDALQQNIVETKRGVDLDDDVSKTTSSQVYFAFNQFSQGSGVDIISAAAGNEYAYEAINKISNGVFTYNLLKALKSGEADFNQDKTISISELQTYVAKATLNMTGGMQKPAFRQSNIYQDIPMLDVADSYTGQWMAAAKSDKVSILRKLLNEENIDVNVFDDDGFTALHYASRQGNIDALEFLINQKANISLKTTSGFSAIYLASLNGHIDATYLLLDKGADLAIMPDYQIKAIADKGNFVINEMLKNFRSVKSKEEIQLVFNKQIVDNNLTDVEAQLKSKSIDPDYFTITTGTSSVFIAIAQKKYDALKMLLKYGAKPNAINDLAKITPLMLAVYINDSEIIKTLLNGGADKSLKDVNGKTALDYAIQLKKEAAVEALK